jgi:uncharacterized protein YlxW (UPF0749 family)
MVNRRMDALSSDHSVLRASIADLIGKEIAAKWKEFDSTFETRMTHFHSITVLTALATVIQTKMPAMVKKIDDEVQKRIVTLRADVKELQDDVQEIQEDVEEIQEDLDNMQEEQSYTDRQVSALEQTAKKFGALETTQKDLEGRLAALGFQEKMQQVDAKLGGLESKVASAEQTRVSMDGYVSVEAGQSLTSHVEHLQKAFKADQEQHRKETDRMLGILNMQNELLLRALGQPTVGALNVSSYPF